MKKVNYEWDFKALNLTDFLLILDFKLDGKLAKYARTGIVKAIRTKTGKKIGKVEVWEDIPASMYGFINLQCKQFIKQIQNSSLNPDGVYIRHHFVKGGEYRDNIKSIDLRVKIEGIYDRK